MTILIDSGIYTTSSRPALLAFFACLCGVYLFCQGLRAWRRRKSSQVAQLTTIRSIRPGTAEVHGKAEGSHTMFTALSGKECFFYRTTIWREDSRKTGEWKKVVEETFSLPFFLADSTGRVLLDPRGAETELPRDVYEEYGKTLLSTHTDIPERLEVFLSRHNISTGAGIRIEEYSIGPATEIFADGTVVKNTDGFGLSATPLNQVKGGYSPSVRSAIAEEAGNPAESSVVTESQAVPDAPPAPASAAPPHAVLASTSPNGTLSAAATAAQPIAIQQEIIRLSLPSPNGQPEEMTMQSRLAAALRRANANSPDTWGMPMPESQANGAAIQEHAVEAPAQSAAPVQSKIAVTHENHAAPAVPSSAPPAPSQKLLQSPSPEAPPKQISSSPAKASSKPSNRPPSLVLRKGADGSALKLSWRSQTESAGRSSIATALVFAGPALTLAGIYYLAIILGWL